MGAEPLFAFWIYFTKLQDKFSLKAMDWLVTNGSRSTQLRVRFTGCSGCLRCPLSMALSQNVLSLSLERTGEIMPCSPAMLERGCTLAPLQKHALET
jgi:hypothetical protein